MTESKITHAAQSPLLGSGQKFNFACHEGLECFKKCCRDISIFLTPFDVLRIKNKLNIPSWEFLEKYTIPFAAGYPGFPLFLIKMMEEDNLKCPFITEQGCGIYAVRPWSCRMAPVEIRGQGVYGFCFDKSHCLGLNEEKEQTVQQWMLEQGIEDYEAVEASFREIPLKLKPSGLKELDGQMMKAFHMSCYDLDRFRKFVFETPFLTLYEVPPEKAEKLKRDDVELLRFGFGWLLSSFHRMEDKKKVDSLLKAFLK